MSRMLRFTSRKPLSECLSTELALQVVNMGHPSGAKLVPG